MKCPKCKGGVHVVETRNVRNTHVFRLRECKECGERFFTMELIVRETDPIYREFQKDWLRYNRGKFEKMN